MNLELNIEELHLIGFSPHERYRVSKAVKNELTRLLGEHGLRIGLNENAHVAQIDAGSFRLLAESKPEKVGGEIARSVYASISKK